jgi:ribosomal protein L34E
MVGLPKAVETESGAALARNDRSGDCGDTLAGVPQVSRPAALRRRRPTRASRTPERFVGFMLGLAVREADIFQQTVVELRK